MRILRVLVALCLLPLCVGVTRAFFGLLLPASANSVLASSAAWALAAGGGLWAFLYLTMPRPVRSYVLAHELTHALWGYLMGARVHAIRVSATGGTTRLSKTNVWIMLAPYFFPFYTALVAAAYRLTLLFWDVSAYYLFWVGALGLTWGFHATFTLSSLMQHQTDIHEAGTVFSYVVIYLLNVLALGLLLTAVTGIGFVRFCAELEAIPWRHGRGVVRRHGTSFNY